MQYPICKKNLLCNLVSSSSVLNRLTSPLLAVLSGTGPVSLHTPPLVRPILLSQSVLCVIMFFITLFSPEHAIRTGRVAEPENLETVPVPTFYLNTVPVPAPVPAPGHVHTYIYIYEYVYIYVYIFANVYVYTY